MLRSYFADLAGYTHLSELMGRQQLTELVNRAFSRFVDEIHRYDGMLLEIVDLMSEESVARVPNDFPFENMGEHSLKNVTKPIRIYRLCGVQSL